MTDLEICKHMAAIEGIKETHWDSDGRSFYSNPEHIKQGMKGYWDEYNPLTDDALCFQLMLKYRIELGVYGTWYGCFRGNKPQGSDGCLSYELSANRAICLAIIEPRE